ncbi:hypothetical protein BC936DRAFT_149962 [Jimgerdemannia flammicorona]|uniref:Uncharacterized protein n=1 Tax=Jimgerdemannia flammicorona TaxID=994334 RepID=A0A433CZS3_9FUNG|nr:hypothetical protein BC936DRAFT_149962 [Jimgerdemannia flammicorona]
MCIVDHYDWHDGWDLSANNTSTQEVHHSPQKYLQIGVWCCWLTDCKKQIDVANYKDNKDSVRATMAELIKG